MSLLRYSRVWQSSAFARSPRAAFSTSILRASGKESSIHHEQRAAEAEATKQEELQKQKKGENEWRREIASDSEEAVKADKDQTHASEDNIKDMQEKTKNVK